jgi:exopolysaccharide biosynthesis polyprenyl glycosylphosphotransferase
LKSIPTRGLWRLLAPRAWPWTLLAADAALLGIALASAALVARPERAGVGRLDVFVSFPLLVLALMAMRGLYSPRESPSALDAVYAAGAALTLAAMTLVTAATAQGFVDDVAPAIASLWLFGLLCVGGGRALLIQARRRAHRHGGAMRRTVIVGGGLVGELVAQRLREQPEHGLLPVGVVDVGAPRGPHPAVPLVGTPAEVLDAVARTGARHVVLAFSTVRDSELVPQVRALHEAGLEVSMVPRLFEVWTPQTEVARLGALPLLELRHVDPKARRLTLKYALDRSVAALLLAAAAPLMLVLAAGVKFTSPGPVIFRQRRVGLDEREFDLVKFRSMRVPEDEPSSFRPRPGLAPGGVEGEDRRTGFGRWLRRSNLDELPQLINVLRGEMSLVGPRPERPDYVELFTNDVARYSERHRIKSGITGWAQVHGLRGQTSIADRVEYDNDYIQHLSPVLDLKILLLTVGALLKTERESEPERRPAQHQAGLEPATQEARRAAG